MNLFGSCSFLPVMHAETSWKQLIDINAVFTGQHSV